MRLNCPHCNVEYNVDESRAGQVIQCAACCEEFLIPMPPPPPPPATIVESRPAPKESEPAIDPKSKTCPMCGETILAVAKKCRFCGTMLDGEQAGTELKKAEKPEPVKLTFLGQIFIIICFFAFVIWALSSCSCTNKNKGSIRDDAEACVFAEQAVMKYVKSPSTANIKFDYLKISFDEKTKKYTIPGYVDAQNSFGATVRRSFVVHVETDGYKGYKVLNVEWK